LFLLNQTMTTDKFDYNLDDDALRALSKDNVHLRDIPDKTYWMVPSIIRHFVERHPFVADAEDLKYAIEEYKRRISSIEDNKYVLSEESMKDFQRDKSKWLQILYKMIRNAADYKIIDFIVSYEKSIPNEIYNFIHESVGSGDEFVTYMKNTKYLIKIRFKDDDDTHDFKQEDTYGILGNIENWDTILKKLGSKGWSGKVTRLKEEHQPGETEKDEDVSSFMNPIQFLDKFLNYRSRYEKRNACLEIDKIDMSAVDGTRAT